MDTQKPEFNHEHTASQADTTSTETVPVTTTEEASPSVSEPRQSRRAAVISIIIAAVLLAGAGYYAFMQTRNTDSIVATINGEPIYQSAYDENARLLEESAVGQGIDPNDATAMADVRAQALNNLIDNALLIGAAEEAGVTVSDEQFAEVYNQLVSEVGGEEALASRMSEIGISAEKLNSNIRERILVDRYIESVSDIESLTVTEEEVKAFITAHIPDTTDMPPLEEIRPVIEAQIISMKQQEIIENIINTLRAEADIEVLI